MKTKVQEKSCTKFFETFDLSPKCTFKWNETFPTEAFVASNLTGELEIENVALSEGESVSSEMFGAQIERKNCWPSTSKTPSENFESLNKRFTGKLLLKSESPKILK